MQAGGQVQRTDPVPFTIVRDCRAPCCADCRGSLPNMYGAPLVVPVLQVTCGQKVTSLTACLVNQTLRLDCRHDNTTLSPILYEFSLSRETKKHVLAGNIGVVEHTYRTRASVNSTYNMKVLYLNGFTNKDEGIYTCELRVAGQSSFVSSMNVSVLRGERSPGPELLPYYGRRSWEAPTGQAKPGPL